MLAFSLLFLSGNLWLQWLPHLPESHAVLMTAGVVVTLLSLIALPWSRIAVWHPVLRGIVAFLLGFVWAWFSARQQLQRDLSPALEGRDVLVIGYVAALPEAESYGQRFLFAVDSTDVALPAQIELTWYAPAPAIKVAERWQLQVRLRRRHGFANPGGYDYEAQLFRDGVGATGYVRNSADNRSLGVKPGLYVLKARAELVNRIVNALPNEPMQGVIRGLAVGDQQAISSDAWQVFARTGVAHLMAISGFHIGMVAWLCAWLGRRLIWLPMAQRWRWTAPGLQAVFGMSGALGYSLLAGMSVPTVRTLIMLAVYFGARLLRRAVNVWHSFGLALLLVLLVEPFAPLTVGTWLSFGAVAVILLNQQGRIGRGPLWREFIKLQVVVTLGMAPLLLIWFGNLSLISPLVNLLAIPWFSVVLAPLVLIGCALLCMHTGLGTLWLHGVAWLLQYTYDALHWCAQWPAATWYWPTVPGWLVALLVIGAVMMVLPWAWRLRCAGAVLCVPAFLWRPEALAAGAFRMTTLDVGQGLAVVMQTRNHVLLYDTGPVFQSGRDTGELVVLPYLHSQGIRQLDVLVASHGDADHVGGVKTLLNNFQVGQFIRGPSVTAESNHDLICAQGMNWQWDEVQFTVLHPDLEQLERSDNDQSCVLRVQGKGGSALLMGDAEKRVEDRLLAAGMMEPTALVEAGHHGSRSSSSEEFVTATQAKYVVFSAGYRNRWGFPKEEVVSRWQAYGAQTESTIDDGAVAFTLLPDGKVLSERYREQHARYWW